MALFYSQHYQHYLAVDCIIFGFDESELKILLVNRGFEPAKGKWSLMGGFLENYENLDDAAKRILYQLTGLKDVFLEQLFTFGDANRDPGERVVSVAYYSLIRIDNYDQDLVDSFNAHWFEITKLPSMIFDHAEMIKLALQKLRSKARYRPIGFELLPEKFTLPQLQYLYEAIFQQTLDKRNFRKKILAMDLLQKFEEKDKSSSKKGAFLYSFDKEKYQELISKGFNFEI
jgi:ADP-ribose pyrophosphatase YjhB (NUDIX family)